MDNLITFLKENPKNLWNRTVRKNKQWMEWLNAEYPAIDSLNEKLFLLSSNMKSAPICAVDGCDNPVNWIRNDHYGETCSYKCSQQLRKQNGTIKNINAKIQQTNLEKYGSTSHMKLKEMQDKRLNTMVERYGAKVSDKARLATQNRAVDMNTKARITIKQRYGVENIQQVPEIRQKTINTFLNRYGTTNVTGIPAVKNKKTLERQNRWKNLLSSITILDETVPVDNLENFPYSNKRIKFICNECGTEDEVPSETVKYRQRAFGSACANCCQIKPTASRDETLISEYLISQGITVIRNTKNIIPPKEIDIWLPDYNIAIEYCGLYWHSELAGKDKSYHINKHQLCSEKGIKLITIFEDEWYHNSEIVKSRLRHLLKINEIKIMARKCDVKLIDNKTAREFCKQNHIQGSGIAIRSIGLFYNDTLVSAMTFSKLNKAKGSKNIDGTWELSRFCSLTNTAVVGGASRLFKKFIDTYNPDSVVSYGDNRWNTGNVYQNLEFEYIGNTATNYWYIDFPSIKRIHRFALRKNETDDNNLTEWENRQIQGWNRIWDCGNSKWIWTKK